MSKPKTSDAAKPAKPKPEPKPEVPNQETREAIEELRRGGGTRHASVDELFKTLGGK
jgi:hypothetical protein